MKPCGPSLARLSFPLASAIAALLAAMQSANAATFYWDNNGTTAGFGNAGGTWAQNSTSGGTSARWKTDVTGVAAGSATQVTTSTDTFNFGTATDGLGAGTITVSGGVTMGNTSFGAASGAIVLTGGTITYGAGSIITVNNTTDTINSVVAGTTLTKNGTGTLILGGNNTLTGTLSVANSGTLVLSGDNSSMTGGVSLSTAGTGASAPKLNINSATAIGTGTLSFGGGAATDTVQIDNTSAGAITLSTNNAITLNRNFTFVGTQSLNMGTGTATLGGMTSGSARGITVSANTLTFGGTVAEGATTNLGINKLGAGTLVLGGSNSYTGTTTITTGTLQLDGSTHASSTVAIGTNGTLTGTGTVNGNATLTGSGTINKSSGTIAGTLGVTGGKWNGAGAVTGLVTSSSGTFTIGNGANLTADGDLSVTGGTIAAGNATSTITGSVNYTSGSSSSFAGIIAGSGKTLTMNNAAATLTLSGANTYTGVTNVNAGFLVIGSSNALGTTAGNTVIASGGQVYISTASLAVAEPFNIAGSGVGGTAGAINFAGSVSGMSISGAVTLSAAATIKGDGNTGSTFTGGINNAGNALTFTLDGGATSTVSTNGISGGGSLTKASTGTLNLNVASTYSGGTEITGGIISVANSATALGSGDVTFNGGTRLAVAAGLNVANNIIIGSNTGAAGKGLLESSGTGTATLSGAITINASAAAGGIFAASTGNDLVVSGLITASVPVTQRTGTVTFSGGGTGYSTLSNNSGITKVGALNGIATTATVTINSTAGAGSLDLNGFDQSLVGISRGSASFTSIIGNSSTTSDSTLTTTGTSAFAGVIQDKDAFGVGTRKVALTVNGGSLTLSGTNTYSGATTVTAGTLQLDGSTHASSTVDIGTAGTLSGSGTVNGNATLTGGGIINKSAGSIAGTLAVTGGYWNGAGTVGGTVSSGTGTFTISSGANLTATSGVTATGGALVVNGTLTGTLIANSSTTISGTGTITGNATIEGTHNPGNSPGIQTFSGNLEYSGGSSVVNWELNGNTTTNAANPNAIFDQIIVGGDLNFADASTINLSFAALGSSVLWSDTFWDTDQSWTLYDVAGTTTGFNNLSLTIVNWLDSSGITFFDTARPDGSFSLSQVDNDIILNYAAIPEPSATLLGGLGLLALLRRRR